MQYVQHVDAVKIGGKAHMQKSNTLHQERMCKACSGIATCCMCQDLRVSAGHQKAAGCSRADLWEPAAGAAGHKSGAKDSWLATIRSQ